MMLGRLFRHLFAGSSAGTFPDSALQAIAAAVQAGEQRHAGEVCFAVEAALAPAQVWSGLQARERAMEVFAQLQVWDTAANNGVLIYLLLADHRIEIVADRGLDDVVSAEQWRGVCQLMEEQLRGGQAQAATVTGVQAVSDILAAHFPHQPGAIDRNELPDWPHRL